MILDRAPRFLKGPVPEGRNQWPTVAALGRLALALRQYELQVRTYWSSVIGRPRSCLDWDGPEAQSFYGVCLLARFMYLTDVGRRGSMTDPATLSATVERWAKQVRGAQQVDPAAARERADRRQRALVQDKRRYRARQSRRRLGEVIVCRPRTKQELVAQLELALPERSRSA